MLLDFDSNVCACSWSWAWDGVAFIGTTTHRSGAAQTVVGSLVDGTCGVVAIGRLDFASSGGLVEGSGSKVSAKQWATFQLHTETTGSVPRFNSHACYENECEKRMQSSLH